MQSEPRSHETTKLKRKERNRDYADYADKEKVFPICEICVIFVSLPYLFFRGFVVKFFPLSYAHFWQ
jgi:hypothetical protein